MTATDTQLEGLTQGHGGRRVWRELSLPAAAGEIFGVLDANVAARTTAVESGQALRRRDGGRIRVRGHHPAEHREQVRHLVIFPAPVL